MPVQDDCTHANVSELFKIYQMHAGVITIMAAGGFNPEICIPGKGDCTNKEGTVFMVYMSGVCSLCANLKFSWLELVKNKDCFISNGLFIWKKK